MLQLQKRPTVVAAEVAIAESPLKKWLRHQWPKQLFKSTCNLFTLKAPSGAEDDEEEESRIATQPFIVRIAGDVPKHAIDLPPLMNK